VVGRDEEDRENPNEPEELALDQVLPLRADGNNHLDGHAAIDYYDTG